MKYLFLPQAPGPSFYDGAPTSTFGAPPPPRRPILGIVMMAILLVQDAARADQDCSQFLQYNSNYTAHRQVRAPRTLLVR